MRYNCQFFVAETLDSINATYNRDFVIQDLSDLVKRIPAWQRRFSVALTDFAREANNVVSIGVDKAKDIRRGVKDTAKDIKKGSKKAIKKTKKMLGFGYNVAMLD